MTNNTILKSTEKAKDLIEKLEEDKFLIMFTHNVIDGRYHKRITLIENWSGEPYKAFIQGFNYDVDMFNGDELLDKNATEDDVAYEFIEYNSLKELEKAGYDFDDYNKLKHKSMMFYGKLNI